MIKSDRQKVSIAKICFGTDIGALAVGNAAHLCIIRIDDRHYDIEDMLCLLISEKLECMSSSYNRKCI